MDKKLFFDVDETLVSSFATASIAHSNQMLETYGQYWEGHKFTLSWGVGWDFAKDYHYVSFLRPWAKEILAWAYETYGRENVFILTRGGADYIFKLFKTLEFDIDNERVFTIEDIEYPKHNFDKFNNVLVDNEVYSYHTEDKFNKIDFLSGISSEKYVKVNHFDVRYFLPKTDVGYVEEVKQNIIKAFG